MKFETIYKLIKNYHLILASGLIVLVGFGFVSCSDDDDQPIVEDELQIYFNRFAIEGRFREVDIDFESIPVSARITFIDERFVAGSCSRHSGNPNQIEINTTFWNRANDLQREYVVFHELGHCYLNREHLEDENNDGSCVSIMASGTGSCREDYAVDTREAYLNELFQ